MTKRCTKCHADLDISAFRKKGKRSPGKFRSQCTDCLSKAYSDYAATHSSSIKAKRDKYRERAKLKYREWYSRNRDAVSIKGKLYRSDKKFKLSAAQRRRWSQLSPEIKKAAYERKKSQRHRWKVKPPTQEQLKARSERRRNRYATDGNVRKYFEEYRRKHKDAMQKYIEAYRIDPGNRDKLRTWAQDRRGRIMQAFGSCTAKEWREIKERYSFTCLRCLRKEPEINLTMDHVVPLTKNGHHSALNIQPLCFSCNSKKRRNVIDYRLGAELMGYWALPLECGRG